MDIQGHQLLKEFVDIGMAEPGQDKDWCINTDMDTHDGKFLDWKDNDPEATLKLLLSKDNREKYQHNRLDRILFDPSKPFNKPKSYHVLTTLTGCTDHLMISTKIGKS